MARSRKDGTPAKAPAKKATVEVVEKLPEEPKVELVYDPSIAEEYKAEQRAKAAKAEAERIRAELAEREKQEPLEIAGVSSRVIRHGKYIKQRDVIKKDQFMLLQGNDVEILLTRKDWLMLCDEIRKALDQLEIREPREPKEKEIEGGGVTWWYVCPECHGDVGAEDKECRHCGQPLEDAHA